MPTVVCGHRIFHLSTNLSHHKPKSLINRLEGDIEKLFLASNYVRFTGCTCPNLEGIASLASDKLFEIILDLSIVTKALDGVLSTLKGEIVQ